MSESSTEKKAEDQPVADQKVDQKDAKAEGLLKAVSAERKQTRAARDRADALEKQLAEAKEQNPQLDVDALMEAVSQTMDERMKGGMAEAIREAIAPMQRELDQRKAAMTLGLNEKQAEAVFELKAKVPGLTDQDALTLVRTNKPDLFPVTSRIQRSFTTLPGGGDSSLREAPKVHDHMADSREARKKGDGDAMARSATEAFKAKLRDVRIRKNGGV